MSDLAPAVSEDQPAEHRNVEQTQTRSDSSARRRHRRRERRVFGLCVKKKNGNLLASVFDMTVVVLLSTALAEPGWFTLHGGGCYRLITDSDVRRDVQHLGLSSFFPMGSFIADNPAAASYYYKFSNEVLVNCVDPQAVYVLHSIIALSFVAIASGLAAFILDLVGPRKTFLKHFRHFAVLNIFTVLLCVTITGFAYWSAQQIEHVQEMTKQHVGSKVQVQFDVAFYLVSAAGLVGVVSVACNTLKPCPRRTRDDRQHLLSEHPSMDNLSTVPYIFALPPPPPPYAP